jgi:hypothetical protein
MNLDRYLYSTNNTYLDYEFDSVGPKGVIKKVVRLSKIGDGIYNLGFGDLNERTSEIYDSVATNNADTEKVLATVAMIAYEFTSVYQGALIYVEGVTPARTRLYQINISKYWEEINKIFEIQGLRNNKWELFRKNVNYDAFLARRHDGAFFVLVKLL